MKTKIFPQKIRLLIVMVITILVGQNVMADNVVGYDLTNSAASTIGQTGTFSVSAGLTAPSFSGDGAASSGWDAAYQYWTISSFNTTGLHTITVGAMMNSDDAGPRDFQLQYKLSGGSWTNVGTAITLSGTQTTFNRTLPDECANVSGLEVRWLNTSTTSLDGGTVTSDASSYIESISILGSLPTRPNTQFSNITFTSITPTTIKLDGTIGNGDHRIIYIVKNATGDVAPSFPEPGDNDVFHANTDYSTGNPTGYQVIYNGTESSVTVTVPSSTNEYWFRVYEYNLNGTMPRYYTPTATKNPYLCALPNIVAAPATLIRLTSATIGATISSSKTGVTARGTQIKLGSSLGNSTTNKVASGSGTGSFNRNITGQTRGSRYYFRGYATNACGTIYSNELYYENIPIFSGTGVWEDNTKWNVLQVPGSTGTGSFGNVADSPIINGNCTFTASNNVTNLTINSSRNLTISKGVSMDVDGTLTNNAGTSGILIKSIDDNSDISANGSLIFASGTPQATVEMFSKSEWNTSNPEGSRFKWQFWGIPVTTLQYSTYFSNIAYVRAWDESVESYWNVWVRTNLDVSLQLDNTSTLTPGLAYEICNQYNRKYSFTGTLNTTDFSKTLRYTPTAYFKGQNLLSNPYTASMDVRNMQFGANTLAAVYLYNTGTYNDWVTSSGETEPGEGPGTYKVLTPGTAGSGGVDAEIAGMQGFIVKATANTGSVSYAKSNLVSNTQKQRAKAVDTKVSTMIDLRGTQFSDRMWVFVDDNATEGFDNGFDGPKMLGNANVSQLYGIGTDDIYQINVLNNINDAYIGVQKGTEESFKLTFNHTNISDKYQSLYLMDLANNQTVDITATGSEYVFTSTDSDPVKRFKIVGNTGTTTSTINTKNDDLKIINQDNKLIIDSKLTDNGELQIFDLAGKIQASFMFNGKSITTAAPNLLKGIYIARLTAGAYGISQRIIIK